MCTCVESMFHLFIHSPWGLKSSISFAYVTLTTNWFSLKIEIRRSWLPVKLYKCHFNILMSFYWFGNFHWWGKIVLWLSYLASRISWLDKAASLYSTSWWHKSHNGSILPGTVGEASQQPSQSELWRSHQAGGTDSLPFCSHRGGYLAVGDLSGTNWI